MAKRGRRGRTVSFGVGPGQNVGIMVTGMAIGMGGDAVYGIMGLPGYNEKIPNCSAITVGDALQILLYSGFTLVGVLTNSVAIPAFTAGLLIGKLIPTIVTPAFGLPRYIIVDFDPQSGSLTPSFRAPEIALGGEKPAIVPPLTGGGGAPGTTEGGAGTPQYHRARRARAEFLPTLY